MSAHTPGPWYVGAQNDMFYIVAGRAPSQGNDHPWHGAPRVGVAKVYGPCEGDCLPIDATANARLIAAAPYLLAALRNLLELAEEYAVAIEGADMERDGALPDQIMVARRALAHATGGA